MSELKNSIKKLEEVVERFDTAPEDVIGDAETSKRLEQLRAERQKLDDTRNEQNLLGTGMKLRIGDMVCCCFGAEQINDNLIEAVLEVLKDHKEKIIEKARKEK